MHDVKLAYDHFVLVSLPLPPATEAIYYTNTVFREAILVNKRLLFPLV